MMDKVWQKARLPVLLLLATMAVAGFAPVVAQQPDWTVVESDMKAIRNNMTNLTVRLKYVAGQGSTQLGNRNAIRKQQPVSGCCSGNLSAIRIHSRELLNNLRVFATDAETAGDTVGAERLTHAAKALLTYHQTFQMVAEAKEFMGARYAMKSAVRDFNHLQRALDEYVECCLEKPEAKADKKTKSRKSRKKKKKKVDDQ